MRWLRVVGIGAGGPDRVTAARGWVMDVYLLRRVAQAGRTWATTQ